MKYRIKRIIVNTIIFLSALVGVYLELTRTGSPENIILFFTIQSNIWIMCVCLLFVLLDIFKKDVPKFLYIIKFIFTVSILVTGIIYNFVLVPQYSAISSSIASLYTLSASLLHIVTPVFSLVSYIFYDRSYKHNRGFCLTGTIMPIVYFTILTIISLVSSNTCLFGKGYACSSFPYFFMDYQKNGWFTLSSNIASLGVFYWVAIIFIAVLIMSKILLLLNNKFSQVSK